MPNFVGRPLSHVEIGTARNVHRALRETAQATLHAECNVTNALKAHDSMPKDKRVAVSTHVLSAALYALKEHPEMNARLAGNELSVYERIRLGIMVDIGGSVMVACIPDAARKMLKELDEAVHALKARAQRRKLAVQDTYGATFTVADLSAHAVDTFTPILLPPAIAILGIGRVRAICQPTPQGWQSASLVSLSLTFDHQGTNELRAGRFMTTLVERVERAYSTSAPLYLN